MTRKDVIIVASVSCIYGLGNPKEYEKMHLFIKKDERVNIKEILKQLVSLRYERSDFSLERGKFSYHGDVLEIFPSYGEEVVRLEFFDDFIEKISVVDSITREPQENLNEIVIYPSTHFVTSEENLEDILHEIEKEMEEVYKKFKKEKKLIEAQRIKERTLEDLEMIRETGYCTGIENYSRYFDGRAPGEPPFCLLDYFPKDYLLIIDESHMTVPQIRGMYFGDKSRKETLIKYGFRLPSALDNRPLKFNEFLEHINQAIYVSATPGPWEFQQVLNEEREKLKKPLLKLEEVEKIPLKKLARSNFVVEQLIRPTYLLDPEISVRPQRDQIKDLIKEI
jgi:excinuclease ABC subunit B